MNRWRYINCFSPRFTIQKSVSGTEFLQKNSVYGIIWFSQSKLDVSLSDTRMGNTLALRGEAKAVRTCKALLFNLSVLLLLLYHPMSR